MSKIDRIGVVGGGTMGNGIAHVFAQNGHAVTLVDVDRDRVDTALATIRKNLDRQAKKGIIEESAVQEIVGRIQGATEMSAIEGADLVVEAVPEKLELKAGILEKLDDIVGDGILASNTSSISITALAARTKRPERVIGMHFMNPVPVMKLVEVIRGLQTSDDVTRRVMEVSESLGKTPVEVNDFPGFVSNRVLMPMINEAVFAAAITGRRRRCHCNTCGKGTGPQTRRRSRDSRRYREGRAHSGIGCSRRWRRNPGR